MRRIEANEKVFVLLVDQVLRQARLFFGTGLGDDVCVYCDDG